MMIALAFLALSAPAAAERVFLDGPRELRIGFRQPTTLDHLKSYQLKVGNQVIKVASVEPVGKPVLPRTKPLEPNRVVLPGTLQSALGANEWDPDGEVTQMTRLSEGVYELVVRLPKGTFQYKIARGGSWAENYGTEFKRDGTNLSLTVPKDGTIVRFVVDFGAKTIKNSLDHPEITAPKELPPVAPPPGDAGYLAAKLTLAESVKPSQVTDTMTLQGGLGPVPIVFAREFLSDPAFTYSGKLGSFWTKSGTTFKVWSPPSTRAEVLLYAGPTGGSPQVVPMKRNEAGTWTASVSGDLHGRFYQYRFESYGQTRVTQDINCFAANRDSSRSMVIDLSRTNPTGWPSQPKIRHRHQTEAVLYELHVRDFTTDPASGVKPAFRGKYPGMVQRGTRLGNFKTGLDYLVDLGVTDIHILPPQNFLTSSDDEYTWGYATNLFNVPEETYSTTPNDPINVIREFKSMVQGMHQAGLRVVLDVVYNHTWPPEGEGSAFEQTVPFYYFRTNDRGENLNESGVGNALHDERPMVRKFVQDSLLYWMDEYKIDGYRFDLIGMFTRDSVAQWSREMRRVRPDVVLYGEPWTGGGPTRFGKSAQRGTGMAVFNDRFRNLFRGELDGPGSGFITGGGGSAKELVSRISGSIDDFADAPTETVNYVSAHDNLTLWDKVAITLPNANSAERERAIRLTGAAVLLSQGMPFLEGGVQIGRTKGGNRNSYNVLQPNVYDWKRATTFTSLNDYYRGLIAIRRQTPGFEHGTAEAVRRDLKFLKVEDGFAVYSVNGGKTIVSLNGTGESRRFSLPGGRFEVIADGQRAGLKALRGASGEVVVPRTSAMVLRLR